MIGVLTHAGGFCLCSRGFNRQVNYAQCPMPHAQSPIPNHG
ncbi:MAG: hypothetical protein AAF630_14675 [Cyanobacteria bacterium P01_C01_bin.38]